jgi:2',3'-cyclic-nucleotide 2'-phosphodiesterase (5'-nucleotidase family)
MNKFFVGIALAALCFSCTQQRYAVSSMKGQRYSLVAANYQNTDPAMQQLISKYKGHLDKEMGQLVGVASQNMPLGRPESLLTNFTSDAMLEIAKDKMTDNDCDLAFVNVHGHRADLAKGNITVGNVYEVYSFDNTLALAKLKGDVLMKIFESYAKMGGAGISGNARLKVKDGKLVSATLNGKPIDKNKVYTVVTLDYLADGNDGMEAMKEAVEIKKTSVTLRDGMMEYIKEQTAKGKEISSVLDGRITIEK